jgi:hypothetical protein
MTANGNGKRVYTPADLVLGASTARAGKLGGNPYLPEIATVVKIIDETPNIKTFRMRFDDPAVQESFSHLPGQVGQFGVFGIGGREGLHPVLDHEGRRGHQGSAQPLRGRQGRHPRPHGLRLSGGSLEG